MIIKKRTQKLPFNTAKRLRAPSNSNLNTTKIAAIDIRERTEKVLEGGWWWWW